MTVIGIGLDVEEVGRIDQTLHRFGQRFLSRVYARGEIAYCMRRRHPSPHLAARFAAKEAVMKALGTGRSLGVIWRDIEVVRKHGPPQLELHGAALARFASMGATRALLTVSHSPTVAMAAVLLVAD